MFQTACALLCNMYFSLGAGLKKDIWNQFKMRFGIKNIAEFYSASESNIAFLNVRGKFGACGRTRPWKASTSMTQVFITFSVAVVNVVIGRY